LLILHDLVKKVNPFLAAGDGSYDE
jgi:hypothetical protein